MGPFPALTPACLSSLLFQHTPHPYPYPSVLHTLQFLECSLFSLPSLPLHVLLPPWVVVSHLSLGPSWWSHLSLGPSWDVILSRNPPRHPPCVLHGPRSGNSSEPVLQVCGVFFVCVCVVFICFPRYTGNWSRAGHAVCSPFTQQ